MATTQTLNPTEAIQYPVSFVDSPGLHAITYCPEDLFEQADRREMVTGSADDSITLRVRRGLSMMEVNGRRQNQSSPFVLELADEPRGATLRAIDEDWAFDASNVERQVLHDDDEPAPERSPSPPEGSDSAEGSDVPDAENPFDYRHYVDDPWDDDPQPPQPESRSQTPLTTPLSTPLTTSSPFKGTPGALGIDLKGRPLSSKATQSNGTRRTAKSSAARTSRASTPEPPAEARDEVDYGGLIIEDSSQPTPKRQRMFAPSEGPISLQRAGNTPTYLHGLSTPSQADPQATWSDAGASYEAEDGGVFDDDEGVDGSGDAQGQDRVGDGRSDDGDELDEDMDVDHFELPAPATTHPSVLETRQSEWAPDELDDLVASLEQDAVPPPEEPVEEVSEEE